MPESPERTALYRLYNVAGRLLYVGISDEPLRRWRMHSREKWWWPEVQRFEITWHGRLDAEKAEKLAIKSEGPLYNRTHSDEYYASLAAKWGKSPKQKPDPIRSRKGRAAALGYKLRIRTLAALMRQGIPYEEAHAEARRVERAYKDESGAFD
jgi:hypothetical protein